MIISTVRSTSRIRELSIGGTLECALLRKLSINRDTLVADTLEDNFNRKKIMKKDAWNNAYTLANVVKVPLRGIFNRY